MNRTYQEKVVWITGASSGIGEALAYEYARRGANLILSARREDVLEKVATNARQMGASDVMVHAFDITDEAHMASHAQKAFGWKERLDLLYNNAGISQRSLAVDTDMAAYRKLFDIDVFGQMALTQAVIPFMISQHFGHLAVTASVAGKIGAPKRTGYCAAKHAMMGYFDALRAELTREGLKVSTVTPGYIKTAVSHNAINGDGSRHGESDPNIENGMPVDACAKVIFKGLDKGEPEIAVGQGMEMKALWLKRLFPKLVFKMTALK